MSLAVRVALDAFCAVISCSGVKEEVPKEVGNLIFALSMRCWKGTRQVCWQTKSW